MASLGAYRLIAQLGHGGMADVFLAAAQGPAGSGFTKLAVVKKLRENLAEEPEFVAMLIDEARITARLAHPNVVQLFEMGEEDGQLFLAIEFLDGQPLHRVERRFRRAGRDVAPEVFYTVLIDVLAGLHYAHELTDYDGSSLDVVHRDVTPHNIFVTYDGAVKVVDFGIAKAMGRRTETQQGVVKGKIRYMAPEQATGGDVDRRADLFAVGVMLWNAATGSKLWADLDDAGVVRGLVTGEFPASPRSIFPDVPQAIDAVCRRALASRPEDRYVTAAEMRGDLERFLGATIADARKTLEASMKTAFVRERAKTRAVLETAHLTSVASADAFAASAATQRARQAPPAAESDPPQDREHTALMKNAPPRPVAARRADAAPRPDSAARGNSRRATGTVPPPSAETRRWLVAMVVGLALAAGALWARQRQRGTDAVGPARTAAEVTPARVALDPGLRTKVTPSGPLTTRLDGAASAASIGPSSQMPPLATTGRRGAPPTPGPTPASSGATTPPSSGATPMPRPPGSNAKPAASANLDRSDPWSR